MAPLLSYLVKMLLCSGILYAYYYVALRNNRIHQWNRYYLLLATLISITLPLLQLPVPFTGKEAPAITAYTTQIITLRTFILKEPSPRPIDYQQVIYGGYCLVAFLLLARTVIGCWRIRRLIKSGPVQHLQPYRFIRSEQVKAPFSFFRYIFWTQDMSPESADGQQILRHELAHVTEKHSVDKLFMELVCAVCWVNPFFHLFKRELAVVHEFIADQRAAGREVADYAQTILQVSLQSRQLSITNNFFHPPIKRRINMLLRQKSNFIIMKKLIALPIITGLIIFISCKQQQRDQDVKPQPSVVDIAYEDLGTIDAENVNHISIQNDTALLMTDYGKTYRVILKGHQFSLNKLKGEFRGPGKELFTFVEDPPTFPGGDKAMAEFLSKNIRYPKEAADKNITGTIFVQFIVDADGTVKNAVTIGPLKGGGLEEEALRVVRAMPKWVAGKQNGHNVAVQFNLPIRYELGDNKDLSLLEPFMLFKKTKGC